MAKTIATVIGVVFILVGIVGFLSPSLMGAHLGPLHNIVHLMSGAASLYFGTKGSLASARTFCSASALFMRCSGSLASWPALENTVCWSFRL